MLENNLHPDVAERPEDLVVYGGIGKAARNWQCYHTIVRELTALRDDETLLVQSGKPVATFETHELAPRVLIANSNLVPQWATWEHFRELDAAGLMMYGQMTAGSWIYIGSQGILQGTYETFAAAARKRFGGTLAGRLVVTAGLGGMGGAQPLAVTMLGGTALCIEVDLRRIERRIETGYLDERAADLDDALRAPGRARAREGRAALDRPRRQRRGDPARARPRAALEIDVVTDQTSAHDPLNGYVPAGLTVEQADALRRADPDEYLRRVGESVLAHVGAIRALAAAGAEAFDYGNALRGLAAAHGDARRVLLPRLRPRLHPAAVLRGQGPVPLGRAVRRPGRHPRDRRARSSSSSATRSTSRAGSRSPREHVHFQGLPARICWLGYGERDRAGARFNEMVACGELRGPIVIGRDHLDAGSVASPERETEAMLDGSDAVADWPILNALLNTACGASWVSVHHGGGVGMGKSIHAGQVVGRRRHPGGGASGIRRTLTRRPGHGDRAPRRRRLSRGARRRRAAAACTCRCSIPSPPRALSAQAVTAAPASARRRCRSSEPPSS